MILLGVPPHSEEAEVKSALETYYSYEEDEIRILGKRTGRDGNNNWIFLASTPLAKVLVEDRGLIIAFKRCPIRPFTSIPRCANCQALTHHVSKCTLAPTCVNCGEQHQAADCQSPPCCVNCTWDNKKKGSTHRINHQASDPACPTFRAAFQQERNRLNSFFGLQTPEHISPHQQHVRQLQFPPGQPPFQHLHQPFPQPYDPNSQGPLEFPPRFFPPGYADHGALQPRPRAPQRAWNNRRRF